MPTPESSNAEALERQLSVLEETLETMEHMGKTTVDATMQACGQEELRGLMASFMKIALLGKEPMKYSCAIMAATRTK